MELNNLASFFICLAIFHSSEIVLVLRYEWSSFSSRSLLLSPSYLLAMAFAICEYMIELHVVIPRTKAVVLDACYWIGIFGIASGEVIRKMAWSTAKTSFSHDVRTQKQTGHELVTHGIYRWCRHPAYVGWYVWAISTQILLGNPVSLVLFTVVIWNFFNQRIVYEEFHLVRFFGQSYERYRKVTPSWMPGIP